jgi:hypothetical protein
MCSWDTQEAEVLEFYHHSFHYTPHLFSLLCEGNIKFCRSVCWQLRNLPDDRARLLNEFPGPSLLKPAGSHPTHINRGAQATKPSLSRYYAHDQGRTNRQYAHQRRNNGFEPISKRKHLGTPWCAYLKPIFSPCFASCSPSGHRVIFEIGVATPPRSLNHTSPIKSSLG